MTRHYEDIKKIVCLGFDGKINKERLLYKK